MLGITKEKILVGAAIIFIAIILWSVVFRKTEVVEEWVLGQKPRTYYAVAPKEQTITQSATVGQTRNPLFL